MIQLNDEFLADVGLVDLPAADRPALLQMVYSEVELRVGTTLSEGLSDGQLEEFEAIVDRNPHRVWAWIGVHTSDFENDPVYRGMCNQMEGTATPSQILCEYVATKWLEVNRPDYQDVVTAEIRRIADEIRCRAPQILTSHTAGASE